MRSLHLFNPDSLDTTSQENPLIDQTAVRLLKQSLKTRHALTLRAEGQSMRPVIFAGEKIHIQSCSIERLRVGDIVLMDLKTHMILHRIYRLTRNHQTKMLECIRTKGDARLIPDRAIRPDNILGKMTGLSGTRFRTAVWRTVDLVFRLLALIFSFLEPAGRFFYRLFFKPAAL